MQFSLAAASALLLTAVSAFSPPAVFENANLVHVVSLEKNYVKETVNVVIQNIGKTSEDEYYVPFDTAKFSHVGGFEVKDRIDHAVGPFIVDKVEEAESDTQYYRIHLPKPIEPGAQQTLGITYYVLDSTTPLPAAVAQEDKQYLQYRFSAYWPSAYATTKQKTEVKFSSGDVPDFTKLPDASGSLSKLQGIKLTYGPFDKQPAGAVQPVAVRYEFTKPVSHVTELDRDIEVSHWGGNVAFEERYDLFNRGANLSTLFNRVKWAQSQFYQPATHALKELRFPLRVGSVDAYYTDVIGNISTSRFRSNKREAVLEIRPRYPVFGGWQFPFTVGWNSDAKNFLRKLAGNQYVLNVPFLEGPRQVEGVAYERVRLQILLPEGAENVKYYTSIPASSISSQSVSLHKTYLDTLGRTAVVIEADNLTDDFRDREVVVAYDYPLLSSLRKPIIVFSSTLAVFVAVWLISGVELKFSKN